MTHIVGQAGSPDRDPPRELQVPGGTFHSLTPRQITSLLAPEGFYLFGEHATVTLNWTNGDHEDPLDRDRSTVVNGPQRSLPERAPLTKAPTKTCLVGVRMERDEHEQLLAMAAERGMTAPELLRVAFFALRMAEEVFHA